MNPRLTSDDPFDEYQVTIGVSPVPTLRFPPNPSPADEIMGSIGSEIVKMYKADIIHGNLTTSNMIIMHPFVTKGPSPTKPVCSLFGR